MVKKAIVSLGELESILGTPREVLRELAGNADSIYRPFPKILPTKVRIIDNPHPKLKSVQSKIDKKILKKVELPSSLLGGVSGKTNKDNALMHSKKEVVVTLDIKDCFPRTKDKMVFKVFKRLGFSTKLSILLTRLTTYKTHLPQGAPTSSSLLNLILLPLEKDIGELLEGKDIRYSFWVDDITLSGNDPQKYLPQVIKLLHRYGFSTRNKKVRVMFKGSPQITTGLTVNAEVRVRKEKINQYKQEILDKKISTASLKSKVSYVAKINQKQAKKLII